MLMNYEPYSYQRFAEEFILDHPEAGLFLDMGMGKTVITLTAINRLMYERFEVNRVLVIAPLRPAVETWPTEIGKWAHLQHLTVSIVTGPLKRREEALRDPADIYVINREMVVWLCDYLREHRMGWPFDMVVIDELSSFKSPGAQRFRALRKVRKKMHRIVGLTGTPAPNGLLDLWPQVFLLDQGAALGRTISGYRERFFLPDKRSRDVVFSWKPRPEAETTIYGLLADTCVSMSSADYVDLPEAIQVRHEITLSPEAMKRYKELERDAFLQVEDQVIDAVNAAVLVGKLSQAAGGSVYDDKGEVVILHFEKENALEELLDASNGKPVLLFYAYKSQRDRIMQMHPEAVDVKTPGAVQRWNDGKISLLLAHPASAGHGLNLQYGGHIIIWYGLPTSLELFQQANKRLHRLGQKQPVLIHYLLVKGTFDMDIMDRILVTKEQRQASLLDALKAKLDDLKKE